MINRLFVAFILMLLVLIAGYAARGSAARAEVLAEGVADQLDRAIENFTEAIRLDPKLVSPMAFEFLHCRQRSGGVGIQDYVRCPDVLNNWFRWRSRLDLWFAKNCVASRGSVGGMIVIGKRYYYDASVGLHSSV